MSSLPLLNEPLSLDALRGLGTMNGLYTVLFGWLLGMTIWQPFFGAVIAHRALPKAQFAALQHKTWPVYFQLSSVLSAACIGLLYYKEPGVLDALLSLRAGGLLSVGTLFANWLVLGPMTSRLLYERDTLEKGEKKGPEVNSVAVKAVMKRFMWVHGVSSLANLFAFFAVVAHALYIGQAGLF
ncbi:hypothetical protein BD626DRAFT_486470 [Schizophyllum amplum]|uniref:TMEM205-like domain-containing protein n=1 Tax=Schizophyllum amplum TaxID=97359 RepID=A0A550CMJ4_9AGAR|nr:hypothetical protein BD626DRAFT_486470 [Auriculariopsis ampla]